MLSETSAELREDGGKYHINVSNPTEMALSAAVVDYWVEFARSGDPNGGATTVQWPQEDAGDSAALLFGSTVTARKGVRGAKCDIWDELFQPLLTSSTQ